MTTQNPPRISKTRRRELVIRRLRQITKDGYVPPGSSVRLFSLFTGNAAWGQKVLLMAVWVTEFFSPYHSTTYRHLRVSLLKNPHTLNIGKAQFSSRRNLSSKVGSLASLCLNRFVPPAAPREGQGKRKQPLTKLHTESGCGTEVPPGTSLARDVCDGAVKLVNCASANTPVSTKWFVY